MTRISRGTAKKQLATVAAILLFAAWSGPSSVEAAAGSPQVCVFMFKGPAAPAVRTDVVKLLAAKGMKMYPRDKFKKVAAKKRVPAHLMGVPSKFAKVAKAAKVDFVVKGSTARTKKGVVLNLLAYNARGAKVWSAKLPMRRGHLGVSAKKVKTGMVVALRGEVADEPEPTFAVADASDTMPTPSAGPVSAPMPAGSGGDSGMFDSPGKLPPPPGASWWAGSSIDITDMATRDIPKVKENVRGEVLALTVGASRLLRTSRVTRGAATPEACSGSACLDDGGNALSIGVDVHPLALVNSRVAGAIGLGLRYTHELSIGGPGSAPAASSHRELMGDLHAEIKLGKAKHAPIIEPSLGAGFTDLPMVDGDVDATRLFYSHASAGLRVRQPIIPKYVELSTAGHYRMGLGISAETRDALGPVSFPASGGFGINAAITVTPIKWMEITAGYDYMRVKAKFGGSEETAYAPVETVDGVHGFRLVAGIRIP